MNFYRSLSIRQKQIVWAWGFLALPVVFYVVIRFYPTGNAMLISLQDWNLLGKRTWTGFDNYAKLWSDPVFWKVFQNTFVYLLLGANVFYKVDGPDLLRLALLIRHGGVYLDMSIFLEADLSWIWNIASMPSQYVFNRYGDLPRALMVVYLYEGGPGVWSVDSPRATKAFEHMGFDNSFIVAERGS